MMADKSWETFGKDDPFFAVCTDPRFKMNNIDNKSLNDFFESGAEHVNKVLGKIQLKYGLPDNVPHFKNILDFGCGNGRLLIPFSKFSKSVTGIDISEPMINNARKNIENRNIYNVQLIQTHDISALNFTDSFDLVHTFIVLQHIPPSIGYNIIEKLISLICDRGYGVIHLIFENKRSPVKNKIYTFKNTHYWIRKLSFLIKGKSPNSPYMQMNSYNLNKVLHIFYKHKISELSLEFTDHGGFLGVVFYFKK